MLVLYGSHEVQDKVMTFSGAEGAFCDGPCFSASSLNKVIHLSKGNEGAKCTPWTQAPRLITVSSLSPRNQQTVRDPHVSLFRLNSPSSVTSLEVNGQIIEAAASEGGVRLRLNIRFHTCNHFSKDGGPARWPSGSCSNADIYTLSSPHLHDRSSALGPLDRLTEYVK